MKRKNFILIIISICILTLFSCSETEEHKAEVIIKFKDNRTAAICVNNFDRNNDSQLSYAEAAAVTELGKTFGESSITSFDELQHFVGLEDISYKAFYGCGNLTSIVIPNNITSIKSASFAYCKSLPSIIIPNSITSIGSEAFRGCDSLISISLPKSVSNIGTDAFADCKKLREVTLYSEKIIDFSHSSYPKIALFVQESLVDKYKEKYDKKFRYIGAIGSKAPDEEIEDNVFSISSGETLEFYPVSNLSQEVKFYASNEWTATCSANWLTFSPKKGGVGSNVLTVSTTSINRTKSVRTAQLILSSNSSKKTVTIKQSDEYAVFDNEEFSCPPEGGSLNITFKTNLSEDKLFLYTSTGMDEWIPELKKNKARTRAELREGKIKTLTVSPNTDVNPRSGAFFLAIKDKQGNPLMLDTLFIYQGGMSDSYYSIDYSADGQVKLLNKSSQGKGIPIVLMGDGFQDRHIADGTYSQVMNQAMNNLFSEEPFKSLKDYFDIYAVTAVSKHNNFGDGYQTALGTVPDHQSMAIKMDTKAVMSYVKQVNEIDSLNTLAVVILNTNIRRGVTYLFYNKDNTPPINYAITLCPVIDDLKSEMFRSVLVHEAVGHGFAKLADEYARSTDGSATEKEIRWLKEYHEEDRLLNVDSESDPTKTIWSRFVSDPEFANENLGAYEGGWSYYTGIYHPSQESMMRSNNAPFNAPSRYAIYSRIMLLATGKKATYEEFVAFDRYHKPSKWSYQARSRFCKIESLWHPARPIFVKRTW